MSDYVVAMREAMPTPVIMNGKIIPVIVSGGSGLPGPAGPDTADALAAFADDDGASLVGTIAEGTAAIQRSVRDKLRDFANIKDFGVVGSGDETALIQAAMNEVAGKRALRFPAGTYSVNTAVNTMPFPWYGGLSVPSNSHLIFDPGATLQGIASANTKTMILSLYDVDNVIIEGANIIGDRESHTYYNLFDTLAKLNSGDYRTKVGYGASFTPTNGMTAIVYQDSISANNGAYAYSGGVWTKTGSESTVAYFTHEHGNGIHINNSRNVWIDKCRISDCAGDGIFIGEDTHGPSDTLTRRIFITGCDIKGHRRQGISIVQGSDILITGNSFRDIGLRQNLQDGAAPRSGIDIESGTLRKSSGITVTGNSFKNCIGGSFINYDGDNVTFSGNNCFDYLVSYGYGVNSTYCGNTLMGTGFNGLGPRTPQAFTYTRVGSLVTATFATAHSLIDGQGFYFEFFDANSRVVHSGLFTVAISSSTVVTLDVGQTLTLASGSGSRGFPANNVTIEGNTLLDGNINVSGKNVTVRGNTIKNFTENVPIYIAAAASDVLIQGNIIDGGTYCIGGVVGSSGVKIDGNIVKNATLGGIRLYSAGEVTNNRVIFCASGIDARDAAATVTGNYINSSGYVGASYGINLLGAHRHQVANNTIASPSNTGIYCASPALIMNNRVVGFTGIIGVQLDGTTANGARVIGNYIECARADTIGKNILITSGTDGARIIGNTLNFTSGSPVNPINTDAGTNSKITNNVHTGTILADATDTQTGNVAY